MPEQLDLTTAIVPTTRTTYRIARISFDWDNQLIRGDVVGSDTVIVGFSYDGSTAVTLMTTLNKIDLSVKSLQRRVLEKLVTDGKLPAGAVSGSPA